MRRNQLKYLIVLLAAAVMILGVYVWTLPGENGKGEGIPYVSKDSDPESIGEESGFGTDYGTLSGGMTDPETAESVSPGTTEPTEPVTVMEVAWIGDSRTVFMGSTEINGVTGSGILPDTVIHARYGGMLTDGEAKTNARKAGESGPKKAVFWFGINDVQLRPNRDSAALFAADYEEVISELSRMSGTCEIYLLSILSTSVLEKDYYEDQDRNIANYNAELKALAGQKGYHYVDLLPVAKGEADFLPDHIHFTDAFYHRLLPYLKDQIGFE